MSIDAAYYLRLCEAHDGLVQISSGELADLVRRVLNAEEALRGVMNELGVPGPDYPAPVANAYELASVVLDAA